MEIMDILKETLEKLLKKLEVDYSKIEISEDEKDVYSMNIESDNPSILIGYHGENIRALQHLIKVMAWKKHGSENQFNILLDADNYRKKQEENVIKMAERKIEMTRKTGRPQILPPMSPYFRRKIHLHCMGAGYDDIETTSQGDDDHRHVVIKLK